MPTTPALLGAGDAGEGNGRDCCCGQTNREFHMASHLRDWRRDNYIGSTLSYARNSRLFLGGRAFETQLTVSRITIPRFASSAM